MRRNSVASFCSLSMLYSQRITSVYLTVVSFLPRLLATFWKSSTFPSSFTEGQLPHSEGRVKKKWLSMNQQPSLNLLNTHFEELNSHCSLGVAQRRFPLRPYHFNDPSTELWLIAKMQKSKHWFKIKHLLQKLQTIWAIRLSQFRFDADAIVISVMQEVLSYLTQQRGRITKLMPGTQHNTPHIYTHPLDYTRMHVDSVHTFQACRRWCCLQWAMTSLVVMERLHDYLTSSRNTCTSRYARLVRSISLDSLWKSSSPPNSQYQARGQ